MRPDVSRQRRQEPGARSPGAAFANRRVTSSCYFSQYRQDYLDGLFQSSIHQGHQLLGFPCVVPFLRTLIFMALPF